MPAPIHQDVIWRFYTEDIQTPLVHELVLDWFPAGSTITAGKGIWDGGTEDTLIIEVISSTMSKDIAENFAQELRDLNNQEAVLVSWTPVTHMLVT